MSALLASRHTLLLVSVLAAALVQGPACRGGGEGSASGATSGETSTGTSSGGESEGASTTAGGLVGTCDPPIAALAPADARLTVDAEGRLRDAQGRDVIMRGLNTGGRSKWAPFVPFPLAADADLAATAAAADAFFERLRPWGVDVVRMPMSWEALEPSRGTYDEGYLDRYEAMVTSAWSRGLRVIVDFHQDIYASPFCGDGFPIWSIGQADPGAPRHDCPGWGIKYLNDAGVRASFDRFWAGEDDLRVDFVAMWSEVLMRLGDHPGVVGFEVINEPGWGTASDQAAWKDEVLAPFYAEALAELRPLAPGLLFFYDDPGIDAVPLADVHFTEVVGEGLVYAPHLYDPGLLAGQAASGLDPLPKLTGMATNRAAQGHAVLLGEFGLAEASLSQGGAEWLTLVLDQVDALRFSATLWECSQAAELWNGEDLSVLGADGEERALLDAFVRPWLRAVAGTDASFAWDGSAGAASASWTADGGVSEIVLPARIFGAEPQVEVSGEGACFTYDPGRGEVRVQAPAGVAVTVTLGL